MAYSSANRVGGTRAGRSQLAGSADIVCLMLSPHVVELEVQEPYKLWLRFDDGITGIVDLSDSAALGGVFAAWSDQDFWRSAHIVAGSGAVAWGDGTEVDVCPLSLYLDVTGQTFDELSSETFSAIAD